MTTNETQTQTAAERFCDVASWLKNQDMEFTKNFPTIKSILNVWKALPTAYNRNTRIDTFIMENIESGNPSERQMAEDLAIVVNAEFRYRYFDFAKARYDVKIRLSEWEFRGRKHKEVILSCFDRYLRYRHGNASISIQTNGDARRAVERLIDGEMKGHESNDFDITITDKLLNAMKEDNPTNDDLQLKYSINI